MAVVACVNNNNVILKLKLTPNNDYNCHPVNMYNYNEYRTM